MKSLVLAVTVAAGLLCSASTADAQFRLRRASGYSYSPGYSYGYPSYYGSSYYGSSYAAPMYYDNNVVTSGYTPYTDSGVVVTSGYTTPGSVVYPSTYYTSPTYASPYYGSSYYGNSYYGSNPYYNNGLNVSPSGAYFGGRRIWRW